MRLSKMAAVGRMGPQRVDVDDTKAEGTHSGESASETVARQQLVCMCVGVCVCMRACACVCACVWTGVWVRRVETATTTTAATARPRSIGGIDYGLCCASAMKITLVYVCMCESVCVCALVREFQIHVARTCERCCCCMAWLLSTVVNSFFLHKSNTHTQAANQPNLYSACTHTHT